MLLITEENPVKMRTMDARFLGKMLKIDLSVFAVHVRVEGMNSQICFQHNPHTTQRNVELSYPYLSCNDLEPKAQRSKGVIIQK